MSLSSFNPHAPLTPPRLHIFEKKKWSGGGA